MTMNLKSYAKLLRVVDARGYFLMALFGFFLAEGFLFPLKDIVIFWAIIFSLLGFGFSINDCFDQREDNLDKTKKNPIVSKEISFKKALTFSFFLAALGLILSSTYGLKVFFLCLAGVILTFFYSAPPLRLKSRFLADLISHGLFAGALIFFLPLLFFGAELNPFYFLTAFSLFFFSIILQLRNEFEDYEIDKSAGLKTTVFILGYQRAGKLLRYFAILYPLTLLPIFLMLSSVKETFLFLFLILTFIFFTLFLLAENHKLVKNYKLLDGYGILACSSILIAVS